MKDIVTAVSEIPAGVGVMPITCPKPFNMYSLGNSGVRGCLLATIMILDYDYKRHTHL